MTRALTHSSWLNAWSLRLGCAALGVDLRVPAAGRALPLPALADGEALDWLFFTEEASLRRALQAAPGDPAGHGPRYWPRHFPLPLLDDKLAFADWLAADVAGPQPLRHWRLADSAAAAYPLLLKARHSWLDGAKLPRGWVCRDAAELAARRHALAADGLPESAFFLQQWLGDAPLQVLSVGGFFDAEDESRHLALVTERVADYGAGPSSSAMLVTVDDVHGLVDRAAQVLRRLRYQGPYELEFLVGGDQVAVLELNPRFWMQHGLFIATGNGLIRRYLGRDSAADRAAMPPPRLLWIDALWLAGRLARLDRRALATIVHWRRRGWRPWLCPSPGFVLRAACWRALQRLRSALGAPAGVAQ